MSLVHDALEKAKREASAKSAKEMGLAESSFGSKAGAGQPFRAPRRIHPAAAAAAAAAVTLVVVGAIYVLSDSEKGSAARPAPPSASEPPPSPAAATAEPAVPAVTPVAPTASEPPPERMPARASAPPPVASPAAPAAAARVASYLRQVTLADGTIVRLGGIAWSQEAPLAYLNGKLYAKGESVAGLFIERIEKEQVVLSGSGGRFILTLR